MELLFQVKPWNTVGRISPISAIDLWTSVLEFIVVSTLTFMRALVFSQQICGFNEFIIQLLCARYYAGSSGGTIVSDRHGPCQWEPCSLVWEKPILLMIRSSMKRSLREKGGRHWKVDIKKKKYTWAGTKSWTWFGLKSLRPIWQYKWGY